MNCFKISRTKSTFQETDFQNHFRAENLHWSCVHLTQKVLLLPSHWGKRHGDLSPARDTSVSLTTLSSCNRPGDRTGRGRAPQCSVCSSLCFDSLPHEVYGNEMISQTWVPCHHSVRLRVGLRPWAVSEGTCFPFQDCGADLEAPAPSVNDSLLSDSILENEPRCSLRSFRAVGFLTAG